MAGHRDLQESKAGVALARWNASLHVHTEYRLLLQKSRDRGQIFWPVDEPPHAGWRRGKLVNYPGHPDSSFQPYQGQSISTINAMSVA
jgi:hypothetical protein